MATFSYPISAANGKLVLTDNASAEAITQILQTRTGERVYRNTYGVDFNEMDTLANLAGILREIELTLTEGTKEYTPLAIGVEGSVTDEGILNVYVEYQDQTQLKNITVQL